MEIDPHAGYNGLHPSAEGCRHDIRQFKPALDQHPDDVDQLPLYGQLAQLPAARLLVIHPDGQPFHAAILKADAGVDLERLPLFDGLKHAARRIGVKPVIFVVNSQRAGRIGHGQPGKGDLGVNVCTAQRRGVPLFIQPDHQAQAAHAPVRQAPPRHCHADAGRGIGFHAVYDDNGVGVARHAPGLDEVFA